MRRLLDVAQAGAAAVVLRRLARGRTRAPALTPRPVPPGVRVSVVVPARDEEARIGPCLSALRAEDAAHEVIVVDDRSADATAVRARALGALVVTGEELPDGWVGKPWALQQGLEAASGDVVVCLDADARPAPGLLGALAHELAQGADLVSAGPRFVTSSELERTLHASMLASLVYRCGPQDTEGVPAGRVVPNGQCHAYRRRTLLGAGGYALARGHMTDDVALGRALAARGLHVAFRDGADLLTVRMHASPAEVWREWGRSIALADVTPRAALAGDVAVVWLVLALPVLRLLALRPRRLDLALLALRWALAVALRRAYGRAVPLAPLADPATAVRLTWSAVRPPRTWRGRTYAAGGRARTSPR